MNDKREMTAREFANEFRRMCDAYLNCMEDGDDCPLFTANICSLDELVNIVPIVEQWAKEHPEKPEKKRKTYAEDFFEKFPNAKKDGRKLPLMCRSSVYGGLCHFGTAEQADCTTCWNEEMEGAEHIPAVPQEMSAREFAEARDRLCDSMNECTGCPIYKACLTDSLTKILPMVEAWAQEHPERSEK